jgi:hypothetical protein
VHTSYDSEQSLNAWLTVDRTWLQSTMPSAVDHAQDGPNNNHDDNNNNNDDDDDNDNDNDNNKDQIRQSTAPSLQSFVLKADRIRPKPAETDRSQPKQTNRNQPKPTEAN